MNSVARRALVIRIGALGDILLTRRLTYSLSLVGLRSTLLAPARHATLLLADPWIETVLDSESPSLVGVFDGSWSEAHRDFEAAIVISDSQGLFRSAQTAAASVIQTSPSPARDDQSIAVQWANAAGSFAPPFALNLPALPADPLSALFSGATVIHSGSGSPRKNWPVERFVELGHALKREGHRVLWVRGPAEARFEEDVSAFDLTDEPTLAALSATLSQATLFVGNDSGVSHLAAAVGAPTLAIYGPTSDAVWRPDGARVATLRSPSGELSAVQVESVLAACRDLSAD